MKIRGCTLKCRVRGLYEIPLSGIGTLKSLLEGWDREDGREGDARGKRYRDICIYITDSLCYKAETNTPL